MPLPKAFRVETKNGLRIINECDYTEDMGKVLGDYVPDMTQASAPIEPQANVNDTVDVTGTTGTVEVVAVEEVVPAAVAPEPATEIVPEPQFSKSGRRKRSESLVGDE